MIKAGKEIYVARIIFEEIVNDPNDVIDEALEHIMDDYDITSVGRNESGEESATVLLRFDCSWYHKDAFWDDHGGGPAEDEMTYTGKSPSEVEDYLEHVLNATVVMDYIDFI